MQTVLALHEHVLHNNVIALALTLTRRCNAQHRSLDAVHHQDAHLACCFCVHECDPAHETLCWQCAQACWFRRHARTAVVATAAAQNPHGVVDTRAMRRHATLSCCCNPIAACIGAHCRQAKTSTHAHDRAMLRLHMTLSKLDRDLLKADESALGQGHADPQERAGRMVNLAAMLQLHRTHLRQTHETHSLVPYEPLFIQYTTLYWPPACHRQVARNAKRRHSVRHLRNDMQHTRSAQHIRAYQEQHKTQ